MPRTRMGLTGNALKVIGQVGASMGATLIAAIVFASLPKATVPADRPAAELTSGGKFAARIPDAQDAGSADAPARGRFVLPLRSAAQGPVEAVAGAVKQPVAAVLGSSAGAATSAGPDAKSDEAMVTRAASAVRSLLSAASGAAVPPLPHAAP